MSHDHGMFQNDLFNGEALSGGPDRDRGIFHRNIFAAEPLGEDTNPRGRVPTRPDPARILYNEGLFHRDLFNGEALGQATPTVTPASDALISELAVTGGAAPSATKTGTSMALPSGDKSGGATAYTPFATPGTALPAEMPAGTSSDIPWMPIALIGGAVVLTVAIVMMSGRKPAAATANRRRARRNARRRRRNRR